MVSDGEIGLFPCEEADFERYRHWINTEEFATALGRCLPVTDAEHRDWCEELIGDDRNVVFAVREVESGRYLGNVWLYGVRWIHRNAELRILLGESGARDCGYGTRACRLMLRVAFEKLGLHKVYLYVGAHNPRAHRCFQKSGFQEEGVLRDEFFLDGRFVDVRRMAAFPS